MIRVIFSDNDLPGAFLIRALTWSKWSHAGLLLPDNSIIDSRFSNKGVKHQPFERFLKHQVDRYTVKVFEDIPDNVADILMTQIGKGYDLSAVIGIPFHRNWQEDDKWFCSELIAWGCEKAGKPIVDKDRWRVTPQDIFEART